MSWVRSRLYVARVVALCSGQVVNILQVTILALSNDHTLPHMLENSKVKNTTVAVHGPRTLESRLNVFTPRLPASPRSQIKDWLRSFAPLSGMPKAERMSLLRQENQWKNELVMWMFPDSVRAQLPHAVQTWLRCWILCAAVYFIVGGAWAYYTYFCFGDILFKPGTMPGQKDVFEQIKVSSVVKRLKPWLAKA